MLGRDHNPRERAGRQGLFLSYFYIYINRNRMQYFALKHQHHTVAFCNFNLEIWSFIAENQIPTNHVLISYKHCCDRRFS